MCVRVILFHPLDQVSTESAGVITKVVGGGSAVSQKMRPSSLSRNSQLKDLLTKGYRCLALLEEIGPQSLLKAAARVVADGALGRSGVAVGGGEVNGEGMAWRDGELQLKHAVRQRLAKLDPFHEVGIFLCELCYFLA